MSLSFKLDVDAGEWDGYVSGHALGHHEQTSGFAKLREEYGFTTSRVGVYENDQLVGGAQLLIQNLPLIGRTASIKWEERPGKSFSRAELDGPENINILLPYKSMGHHGVIPGITLWSRGKVKRDDSGQLFFEAGFEGPGKHSRQVWEDWLVTLASKVYKLYPGTLAMRWEFSRIGKCKMPYIDLFARIR